MNLPDCLAIYEDAEFYVLEFANRCFELPCYRRHAKKLGAPVLEVACGTGRLTIPLARDGHDLTGLDVSPRMIALARRKSAAAGLIIEWLEQDFRDMHLSRQFAFIFRPTNACSTSPPWMTPARSFSPPAAKAAAAAFAIGETPPRLFWPARLLRNLFFLAVVLLHGFRRLLLPSISTGIFGYPVESAATIAVQTARDSPAHPRRWSMSPSAASPRPTTRFTIDWFYNRHETRSPVSPLVLG